MNGSKKKEVPEFPNLHIARRYNKAILHPTSSFSSTMVSPEEFESGVEEVIRDAKRRGLQYREREFGKFNTPYPNEDARNRHEHIPKYDCRLRVVIPPFTLYGILPYSNIELGIWYDGELQAVFTEVTDWDWHYRKRDYPHPNIYNGRGGYICSLGLTEHTTIHIKNSNYSAIIPTAIRVATRGQEDTAYQKPLDIPFCRGCSRWIGKFLDDPMSIRGGYTKEYLSKHKNGCYICEGQDSLVNYCPSCLEEHYNRVVKCSRCSRGVCEAHRMSGKCRTCYIEQNF